MNEFQMVREKIASLCTQLEDAMHKETAMLLDLEREQKEVTYLEGLVAEERARLAWCLEHEAVIDDRKTQLCWWSQGECKELCVIDGDVEGAIDVARDSQ